MRALILLLTFVLSLVANAAPTKPRLSLIMLSNFSCPYSKQMDGQADLIRATAAQYGIRFSVGMVPAMNEDGSYPTWARERAYYALRDAGMEKAARELLYQGVQEMKLPLDTDDAVLAWLEGKPGINVDLEELRQWMRPGSSAELSVLKAIRHLQWVDSTPSFVFVREAEQVLVLSPKATGEDLGKLQAEVLSRIPDFAAGKF